jgi:undecaprenyl diphosphate synthase
MEKNNSSTKSIDMDRMPGHIAIIMDGNGRWAQRNGKTRSQGHEAGARNVREITEACREIGVRVLTLYAFSTENWSRPKREVESLFRLISRAMQKYAKKINETDVRLRHIGDLEALPKQAVQDVLKCEKLTNNNKTMDVCMALNYGGRKEIVRATQAIAQKILDGELQPNEIDENTIAQHLYLPEHAEVDLLIRTSGEMRISNFMLWQISYSEIVVTPTLWPDFDKKCLHDAIVEYQARDRRFGGRP